jgi:hypothetical protein
MSYTVIGDAVNLAARLEGLNKKFGTRVLVSEFVALDAPAVQEALVLRLLGRIRVVGKEDAVRVFEVVGLTGAEPRGEDESFALSHPTPVSHALASESLHAVSNRADMMQPLTPSGRSASAAAVYRPSTKPLATGSFSASVGTRPASHEVSSALRNRAGCLQQLVRAALELGPSETALSASPRVTAFCEAYTSACYLFCAGRPAECLDALRALGVTFPEFISLDAIPPDPILLRSVSVGTLRKATHGSLQDLRSPSTAAATITLTSDINAPSPFAAGVQEAREGGATVLSPPESAPFAPTSPMAGLPVHGGSILSFLGGAITLVTSLDTTTTHAPGAACPTDRGYAPITAAEHSASVIEFAVLSEPNALNRTASNQHAKATFARTTLRLSVAVSARYLAEECQRELLQGCDAEHDGVMKAFEK